MFVSDVQKESKVFQVDGKNMEGVDIDSFMNMAVQQFMESRKSILKHLKSKFQNSYSIDRGKHSFSLTSSQAI